MKKAIKAIVKGLPLAAGCVMLFYGIIRLLFWIHSDAVLVVSVLAFAWMIGSGFFKEALDERSN